MKQRAPAKAGVTDETSPQQGEETMTFSGVHELNSTHVVIGGIVFPYAAKAPYTRSGYSLLGALEYNEAADKIRCHCCGIWYSELSIHIAKTEGMTPSQYKATFGLRQKTSLLAPGIRFKKRQTFVRTGNIKNILSRRRDIASHATKDMSSKVAGSAEGKNLRMLCRAQLQQRLLSIIKELNRIPMERELYRGYQLVPQSIAHSFGVKTMREVWQEMGFIRKARMKYGDTRASRFTYESSDGQVL